MAFSAFEAYAAERGIPVSASSEPQNGDYEAGVIEVDDEIWHIRTARTTPTKLGAFVAFWRRDERGKSAPFGADEIDAGLLVFVEQRNKRGVFRFTAQHLAELNVTSANGMGKRGFRVYPSWCEVLNSQAAATQRAQASAFLDLAEVWEA
ncbi:MepB family protein (plasmid) [Coraliomargarita sp. W4R53]